MIDSKHPDLEPWTHGGTVVAEGWNKEDQCLIVVVRFSYTCVTYTILRAWKSTVRGGLCVSQDHNNLSADDALAKLAEALA